MKPEYLNLDGRGCLFVCLFVCFWLMYVRIRMPINNKTYLYLLTILVLFVAMDERRKYSRQSTYRGEKGRYAAGEK